MKPRLYTSLVAIIILSLILPACSGKPKGPTNCKNDICLELSVKVGHYMDDPRVATLEVSTKRDFQDLNVRITAEWGPEIQFLDPQTQYTTGDSGPVMPYMEWSQDTVVGETYVFTTTVVFPKTGTYQLMGSAESAGSEGHSVYWQTLLH